SPLVSVIVTLVLLNVALMWAMPTVTLRRVLRRLLLATTVSLLTLSKCSITRRIGPIPRGRCRRSVVLPPAEKPRYLRSCLPEILHAFLAGQGLLRALARAGVRASSLAANRQPAAMP